MLLTSAIWRDANYVPLQFGGITTVANQTLSASGATAATAIFTITGAIEVRALYGEVMTDFGANNTAAYYRLNDQTAQVNITVNTGTTLSAIKTGSIIAKAGLAAAAVVLINNSAGRINEPTTLETDYFSPFNVVKKTGATTNIEFVYTTSDTPTTGALRHYLRWIPLSSDANVVSAL